MVKYSFFRFERNMDPRWRGGISKRWVFKFPVHDKFFVYEEDLIDEIKTRIEDEEEEEGLWQVIEHHKGKFNIWFGPWEVYLDG